MIIRGSPSASACRSSSVRRTPWMLTRSYSDVTLVSSTATSTSPRSRRASSASVLSFPPLQLSAMGSRVPCDDCGTRPSVARRGQRLPVRDDASPSSHPRHQCLAPVVEDLIDGGNDEKRRHGGGEDSADHPAAHRGQ